MNAFHISRLSFAQARRERLLSPDRSAAPRPTPARRRPRSSQVYRKEPFQRNPAPPRFTGYARRSHRSSQACRRGYFQYRPAPNLVGPGMGKGPWCELFSHQGPFLLSLPTLKKEMPIEFYPPSSSRSRGPSPAGRAARVEKVVTMNRHIGGEGFREAGASARLPAMNTQPKKQGCPAPGEGVQIEKKVKWNASRPGEGTGGRLGRPPEKRGYVVRRALGIARQ